MRTYAETEVGTTIPEREFRITRADLIRYAGASGDFNPIHWSHRIATEVGLPDVIAHGMLTMALAGRLLTEWSGDPGSVVEIGTRFAKPVVVPDDDAGSIVTMSGRVVEKLGDGRVRVEVRAVYNGTRVLSQAKAVLRLRSSGELA